MLGGTNMKWFGLILVGAVLMPGMVGVLAEERESKFDYEFLAELDPMRPLGRSHTFRIENVRPGESKKVRATLRNISSFDVQLEDVSTSCKCTNAKVPRRTLKPGEEVNAFFELSTNANPREINEKHSVAIYGDDRFGRINLTFHIGFRDAVIFAQPAAHIFFVEDSKQMAFDLPLVASSESDFDDLKIELAKELDFVEPKLIVDGSKPVVKCSFKPLAGFPPGVDRVSGEVTAITKKGFRSSILCTISKETFLQIMPDLLVFSRKESIEGARQATAILKLREKPDSRPSDLREAKCSTIDGTVLPCEFTRLGRGVYRLRVDLALDIALDAKKNVFWEFVLENGQVHEGKSNFSIPN
jgi:hypothetical protein